MNNKIERYFFNIITWLEKYIEKAGYYSDWEQRKQIQNNTVIREDMNGSRKEEKLGSFAAGGLFAADVGAGNIKVPLKQAKKQLYKWIDATKIKADNCPERLKLIFYAINEVVEGRNEKLLHDIKNRKRKNEPGSPEYQKSLDEFFSKATEFLGKELPYEELGGDPVQGEKIFQEIIDTASLADYENFHWFPQKEEVPLDDSLSAQNAIQELQKILDEAKKLEENKDSSQAEIEEVIQKLTEFKNNSPAHEGKNDYAWKKLEAGDKLASLKIKVKMNNFKAQHSGKDCGDCKKISDLRDKLIEKEKELEVAQRENKPASEVKKEIASLEAKLLKELTKPNEPIEEKGSSNTKYWIIGISATFLVGLIIAATAAVIKNRRKKV